MAAVPDPLPASRGLFALAGVILIWSTIATVLKYFTDVLDPWAMIGVRYTMVALAAAPLLGHAWLKDRTAIPWRAAWIPATVFGIGQITWSIAPYHNPASLLMFIGRCAFFFSCVTGFLLLASERWMLRRPLFWTGFTIICAGLGLLFMTAAGQDGEAAGTSVFGIVIMTATALCWGSYGVTVKRWMPGVPARIGFPLIALLIWPPLAATCLIWGDLTPLATLTAGQWTLLVVASIGSIGLGQFLSYICMQTLGPIVTEGSYNVIPFTTALLAGLLLGERLPPLMWVAGCILLAGSACLLLLRARGRIRST